MWRSGLCSRALDRSDERIEFQKERKSKNPLQADLNIIGCNESLSIKEIDNKEFISKI